MGNPNRSLPYSLGDGRTLSNGTSGQPAFEQPTDVGWLSFFCPAEDSSVSRTTAAMTPVNAKGIKMSRLIILKTRRRSDYSTPSGKRNRKDRRSLGKRTGSPQGAPQNRGGAGPRSRPASAPKVGPRTGVRHGAHDCDAPPARTNPSWSDPPRSQRDRPSGGAGKRPTQTRTATVRRPETHPPVHQTSDGP